MKKVLSFFLIFSIFFNIFITTPLVHAETFNDHYITGYLDENDQIVLIEHQRQDRIATETIVVWIGGTIVGYLSASVIDGIVISATGKSGGEWVSEAIKKVVGKKFISRVDLLSTNNCHIYPPNSQAGANCN